MVWKHKRILVDADCDDRELSSRLSTILDRTYTKMASYYLGVNYQEQY
ncbi:MAG: hypothetical protein ACE5JU_09630 [Candidatus Binatia bacterium]